MCRMHVIATILSLPDLVPTPLYACHRYDPIATRPRTYSSFIKLSTYLLTSGAVPPFFSSCPVCTSQCALSNFYCHHCPSLSTMYTCRPIHVPLPLSSYVWVPSRPTAGSIWAHEPAQSSSNSRTQRHQNRRSSGRTSIFS